MQPKQVVVFGKALKAIIFSIKQVNLKQIIVPNHNSEQKHMQFMVGREKLEQCITVN